MTKITWAATSAIAALAAACTTEVVNGTNDGGTGTSAGSGGAAGSSTTGSSGAGTTGGSGGSSGGSGGSLDGGRGDVCTAKAGDTACRTCALEKCHDETCGCESNTACAANVDDFYTCLSSATGTLADCSGTFSINSNAIDGGASWSNDLGSCMADCENRCKGIDAGPRR
jgi:hypothetical protein